MYKIISPTGVSVTKTLTEEEVNKLRAGKYFTVISLQPKVSIGGGLCLACEG